MAKLAFQLPVKFGPRILIDAAMTALFVSSLAFRATGRAPHEWIGMGFVLLFALHTAINWSWYCSLIRGSYGARRLFNTATNLALLAGMLTACVTGVLQSRHIFGLAGYFDGESLRALHSLAAYWSLVFIGLHTGLHWSMITGFFRKKASQIAPRAGGLLRPLSSLAIAFGGIWASFDRDMGSKLFLGFSFDFWDPARPLALFYIANLAIIGLYAFIAHYTFRMLKVSRRPAPTMCEARIHNGKECI